MSVGGAGTTGCAESANLLKANSTIEQRLLNRQVAIYERFQVIKNTPNKGVRSIYRIRRTGRRSMINKASTGKHLKVERNIKSIRRTQRGRGSLQNKGLLKRLGQDFSERTAMAQAYVNYIEHIVEIDRRVSPKVFGIAMRRAGAKDLIDVYPLRFLYWEILQFSQQADKGVPLLIKEANDGARIKLAAKKYRTAHPKRKPHLLVLDEVGSDAEMLLLP